MATRLADDEPAVRSGEQPASASAPALHRDAAEENEDGAGSEDVDQHKDSQHVTDAPPFWWNPHSTSITTQRNNNHQRSVSYQSLNQTRPAAITLEDHSEEDHEFTQSCWAHSVAIDDYIVVSGPSGMGAYVVWSCTVSTLKGGELNIRKRYSEFDRLRENLITTFPHAEAMIPTLPRKSVVSRFRPKFLEQRRNGLEHFLNCVLLNPEFASSPMLKDFIFN